jgi:HEAT repeat protein
LLAVENAESTMAAPTPQALSRNTTEEHDEGYADYYGNLIGIVADLNDERAIPALLGAISSGGMATRALARFGDKAFNPLLDQLRNPDPQVRSSVLFTIRDLLEMHISIAPASQARIREVLRSSLADPEFAIRGSAVSAIEYLDDREQFVPALEKLAESDPVKLPGKPDDGGDGGKFYPLRQDARRLLRKIANHEPPVIVHRGSH